MAAPRIDPKLMRPSRAWYWVAGAIALLGIIVAGFLFFSILRPLFDPIEDFTAPGSVTVDVDAGDTRTIYERIERIDSNADAFGGSSGVSPNDLACSVRGPDERPVDVARADGFRYTRNSDDYEAKLEFEARQSGDQVVTCRLRDTPQQRLPLAVGPHFGTTGFVARLLGFFAALFGLPLIGGLVALLVFLARQRSKKKLQAQERASWPPPGGAGGPGGAPPPPFMNA